MSALNFDPYAALAAIENGTGLRAKGANRANLTAQPPAQTLAPLAQLALSPTPDRKTAWTDPTAWQDALARLDAAMPAPGYAPERWWQLVEDARWLADRHGRAAAALGWTASVLFGLDATLDGWGGVADRLRGARRVAFTDRLAHWRGEELEGWLWRRTLRPMAPLWHARC